MTATHIQLAPQPHVPPTHALGVVRAGVGVARLVFPDTVFPGLAPLALSSHGRLVVRALGVRQIAQAIVTNRDPVPAIVRLGAVVDVAHAASMIGLAFIDRRYRRAALADAGVAAVFALAGLVAASRSAGAE
jgi:hypothetical protein